MSTHAVLSAQPITKLKCPSRCCTCQCGTESCTCTYENEFLNLSNCDHYPNGDEIDGDCSMDDEDTDICNEADQNARNAGGASVDYNFLCGRPHGADPFPVRRRPPEPDLSLRVDVINGWPLIVSANADSSSQN